MRSITSILLFLGGIALIFWAAKPLWLEISTLRQERNGVLGTLSELKNLEVARDDLLFAYNSIAKSDLEKLNQVIPQNSDTGGVLVSLERIAQDRGIRLRKAEFKIETDNGTKAIQAKNSMFNTLGVSFVVSASYDSFKSFIDAIERNSRVIDINNISFSVGQTNLFEFIVQADAFYGKAIPKVANLQEVGSLKINTSFFSDPRFSGLESVPAPSLDIKKGRTNPFVPI